MAVNFPIPADELTAIRTDVAAALLCDTATVYDRNLTSDGAGGQTATQTSRGSFSCFVDAKPTQPDDNAGVQSSPVDASFYFETSVVCEAGDKIVFDGDTYEALSTDYGIMLRVDARQVNL